MLLSVMGDSLFFPVAVESTRQSKSSDEDSVAILPCIESTSPSSTTSSVASDSTMVPVVKRLRNISSRLIFFSCKAAAYCSRLILVSSETYWTNSSNLSASEVTAASRSANARCLSIELRQNVSDVSGPSRSTTNSSGGEAKGTRGCCREVVAFGM